MKSGGGSRNFWREKNLAPWSETWAAKIGHPPAWLGTLSGRKDLVGAEKNQH
jgi:hypothetical protein